MSYEIFLVTFFIKRLSHFYWSFIFLLLPLLDNSPYFLHRIMRTSSFLSGNSPILSRPIFHITFSIGWFPQFYGSVDAVVYVCVRGFFIGQYRPVLNRIMAKFRGGEMADWKTCFDRAWIFWRYKRELSTPGGNLKEPIAINNSLNPWNIQKRN